MNRLWAMDNAVLRPFLPDDADWVVERHATAYRRDEGFDDTFGPVVRRILDAFIASPSPDQAGWIAEAAHARLGSIFVVPDTPRIARLRLVYLEPEARGGGLAQRMMDTALDFTRARGFQRMCLWTHESHAAAGRLYARNGFSLTESTPKHSFGVDVVAQTWERTL